MIFARSPVSVHAQLLGAGEGLAVGGFGWLNIRGIALRVDDAEKLQNLTPAILVSYVQRRVRGHTRRVEGPPLFAQPVNRPFTHVG